MKKVHRDTLQLVLDETNRIYGEAVAKRAAQERAAREREEQHRQHIREVADDIKFD